MNEKEVIFDKTKTKNDDIMAKDLKKNYINLSMSELKRNTKLNDDPRISLKNQNKENYEYFTN